MPEYVLKIVTDKEKLSQRCDEINVLQEGEKALNIITKLKDTLKAKPNNIALAAPQLGYNTRIFVIRFADGEFKTYINPMITKTEGIHLSREFNPSLPNKEYLIPRYNKIMVLFQNLKGAVDQHVIEGVVAEVFQQQVQLLDGVLLDDFGLEIFPEFDKASKKQQQEVIDWWLNNLKEKDSNLNKEINENKELLEVKKAIDFMAGVAKGDIKLEKVELKKEKDGGN